MKNIFATALLLAAVVMQAQAQAGAGKGPAPQGAPRGGAPAQPPLGNTPKPAIPDAKPVRSCESLAKVALPNTTIESAEVDANNPDVCRVTAVTTHPPAGRQSADLGCDSDDELERPIHGNGRRWVFRRQRGRRESAVGTGLRAAGDRYRARGRQRQLRHGLHRALGLAGDP